MSNEKMREEFEGWTLRTTEDPERLRRFADGGYVDPTVHLTWWAWIESRAAIEVELPQEEPGYMYYAPEVVEAIESLGLKVKP